MPTFFHTVVEGNPLLEAAYALAKRVHHGARRKNGEAYFDHCIAVAEAVLAWGLDAPAVAAALLHDVPEDQAVREEMVRGAGEEVAFLVDRVERVSRVRYNGLQTNTENIRKLILFLAQDVRAVLIRLASRLHNMRSLYVFPVPDQRRIALETMDIYAPLAYAFGMHRVSAELEDLAFPYIYPHEHAWLMEAVKVRREDQERYLVTLMPRLHEALAAYEVPVTAINARVKHYTSLYRKLLRYEMNLEKVHDLVALRLIVPEVRDCYTALGVIHNVWTPVAGRIKDYIAIPKKNGYRSLHTTVLTPEGKSVEIQIRTEAMHDEAEYGIAAHLRYVLGKGTAAYAKRRASLASADEMEILRQFRGWQEHFGGRREMPSDVKIDLFRDKVLILTPKYDVVELPKGATPVDFSYKIHSEVGNHAMGAKVNGAMVPLNHVLSSGDVVEILTQKNKKPSPSWLGFIKTSHARHHVKAALRGVAGFFQGTPKPVRTVVLLTVEDRLGIIKEVSSLFDEQSIRLQSVHTKPASWLARAPQIALECRALLSRERSDLIKKLQKLNGVKKVTVRTVS